MAFFAKKTIFVVLDAREMGREQKKGGGRGGEREKGNACPQTPCFCRTPCLVPRPLADFHLLISVNPFRITWSRRESGSCHGGKIGRSGKFELIFDTNAQLMLRSISLFRVYIKVFFILWKAPLRRAIF